jgi:hypothetical protein
MWNTFCCINDLWSLNHKRRIYAQNVWVKSLFQITEDKKVHNKHSFLKRTITVVLPVHSFR